MLNLDLMEIVRRALKYIVEGVAVAIAACCLPKKGALKMEEVLMLALTAAATFAILDMYVPSIGNSARSGAGLGIGANLVGFPR